MQNLNMMYKLMLIWQMSLMESEAKVQNMELQNLLPEDQMDVFVFGILDKKLLWFLWNQLKVNLSNLIAGQ